MRVAFGGFEKGLHPKPLPPCWNGQTLTRDWVSEAWPAGGRNLADVLRTAAGQAEEVLAALEALADETAVVLSLPSLPLPPLAHPPGWQLGEFEARLRSVPGKLAADAACRPGIRIVGCQRLDLMSPLSGRLDVKSELTAGFPYRLSHAAALADLLARLIGPTPPKKALITDLDGTLWKGILGEVGASGVRWDFEGHGHAHALYQQFLSSLAEAGILVGVASKNDALLVEQVFQRPDCLLLREQVFPCEAHWGAKSESVARILGRLADRSRERGIRRRRSHADSPRSRRPIPTSNAWPFPRSIRRYSELLVELRDLFGRSALSEEDLLRRESLRRAGPSYASASGGNTGCVIGSASRRLVSRGSAGESKDWHRQGAARPARDRALERRPTSST